MNYSKYLSKFAKKEKIFNEHAKKQAWIAQKKKGFLRYRIPQLALAEFQANYFDGSGDSIIIGGADEVSAVKRDTIRTHLKEFMPWRKGPFSVFGIDIDAEWQSNIKWDMLTAHLPNLTGQVIADVGCNNGYYMFRMASHKPKFVLGFEPSIQHYYCFRALNGMAGCDNLDIDLLGVEYLSLFEQCFDTIFLMGVIYHRPSPVDTLRDILIALKPGGTMILETQAIVGEEPVALFPDKTYAKVPGTYFVPTASCLRNWVQKAGFGNIKLFASHAMNSVVQRKTEWMVFESFEDYIDPEDFTKTIEGYPAPYRLFLSAQKRCI